VCASLNASGGLRSRPKSAEHFAVSRCFPAGPPRTFPDARTVRLLISGRARTTWAHRTDMDHPPMSLKCAGDRPCVLAVGLALSDVRDEPSIHGHELEVRGTHACPSDWRFFGFPVAATGRHRALAGAHPLHSDPPPLQTMAPPLPCA